MTESADREGMFTHPRLLSGPNPLVSVVTCTWCGCLVADTEAHRETHATTVTRGSNKRT